MVKNTLKYMIVFFFLISVFLLSMVLCCCFSSELIEQNVKESAQILLEEGMYLFAGPSIVDNGVDALIINAAYSVDNKKPIFSALSVRKNYNPDTTKIELKDVEGDIMTFHLPKEQMELIEINGFMYSKDKRENIEVEGEDYSIDKTSYKVVVDGNAFYRNKYDSIKELACFVNDEVDTSVEYARYWHGYLPIIRVLLLFMNISEIRILTIVILNIMLIYMLKLLKKNFNTTISIIIGFSLICYNYVFIGFSLSAAQIFVVMMLGTIILLKMIEKKKNFDFNLYMLIIGMCTNFVDYLTVPLVTFGLPTIIYFLHKKSELTDCKKSIILLIKAGLMWGLGYGLTFFSKWLIFDFLFDRNIFELGVRQMFYRTEGEIVDNMKITMPQIMTIFLSFANVFCMILLFFTLKKYEFSKKECTKTVLKNDLVLILIGIMPIAWHILLSNHTIIHWKYHYRDMFLFCIIVLLILNDMFVLKKIIGRDKLDVNVEKL